MPYGRGDQHYVIDLCDQVLGETALREHRFDWLRGDPNARGTRSKLPVDAYYPRHQLVVEYWEYQHDHPSAFFDKRDRNTVSGVHRGEQRARYDRRRQEEIPRHSLRLAIIRATDLACDRRGRLVGDRAQDLATIARIVRAPPLGTHHSGHFSGPADATQHPRLNRTSAAKGVFQRLRERIMAKNPEDQPQVGSHGIQRTGTVRVPNRFSTFVRGDHLDGWTPAQRRVEDVPVVGESRAFVAYESARRDALRDLQAAHDDLERLRAVMLVNALYELQVPMVADLAGQFVDRAMDEAGAQFWSWTHAWMQLAEPHWQTYVDEQNRLVAEVGEPEAQEVADNRATPELRRIIHRATR